MFSQETDAFVLQLQDLGEIDRLAVLLTPDRGLLRAVARGARRSQKRFAGHLDVLRKVRITFELRPGSGLQRLLSCQTLNAYSTLRGRLPKFALAMLAVELTSRLAQEGNPDTTPFSVLDEVLTSIQAAEHVGAADVAHVALRILHAEGFLPDLSHCMMCGVALRPDRLPCGSVLPAGLICADCGGTGLTGAALTWLSAAARKSLGQVLPPLDDSREAAAVAQIALSWARQIIGRPLQSESFLGEVLGAVSDA